MNKIQFRKILQDYLDELSTFCVENRILIKGVSLDHVCYKCSSNEEYENIRRMFEYEDIFVYQSIISKRRIAYIGLGESLQSIFGAVNYLELSDQKPDNSQESKCDHVEPLPININYKEMVELFEKHSLKTEISNKPHHQTYDIILPCGVKLKLSRCPLIDKIYEDELKIIR
jgi:predicted metalloenzyme YecM